MSNNNDLRAPISLSRSSSDPDGREGRLENIESALLAVIPRHQWTRVVKNKLPYLSGWIIIELKQVSFLLSYAPWHSLLGFCLYEVKILLSLYNSGFLHPNNISIIGAPTPSGETFYNIKYEIIYRSPTFPCLQGVGDLALT